MADKKEQRPKLKLELTVMDSTLEIAGWMLLLLFWLSILVFYYEIPYKIPTLFNLAGQPDSYGSRATMLILPLIGTLLYARLTILNRYPHVFNYPVAITDQNAERQYTIATRLVRYLKFVIVVVFSIIAIISFQTASGKFPGMGAWFIPLFLGLIYPPLVYAIVRMFRKK